MNVLGLTSFHYSGREAPNNRGIISRVMILLTCLLVFDVMISGSERRKRDFQRFVELHSKFLNFYLFNRRDIPTILIRLNLYFQYFFKTKSLLFHKLSAKGSPTAPSSVNKFLAFFLHS